VIEEARKITKQPIRVNISPRRAGDPPALVADAAKAYGTLNWKPEHSDLQTIIETAWQWELNKRY